MPQDFLFQLDDQILVVFGYSLSLRVSLPVGLLPVVKRPQCLPMVRAKRSEGRIPSEAAAHVELALWKPVYDGSNFLHGNTKQLHDNGIDVPSKP